MPQDGFTLAFCKHCSGSRSTVSQGMVMPMHMSYICCLHGRDCLLILIGHHGHDSDGIRQEHPCFWGHRGGCASIKNISSLKGNTSTRRLQLSEAAKEGCAVSSSGSKVSRSSLSITQHSQAHRCQNHDDYLPILLEHSKLVARLPGKSSWMVTDASATLFQGTSGHVLWGILRRPCHLCCTNMFHDRVNVLSAERLC